MRARAHLATTRHTRGSGPSRSCVSELRSDGPLVLRPNIGTGREPGVHGAAHAARVSLAAGAAAPIGGDRLELDVRVGAGTTLVLTEVSHTLCLPGRDGARSVTSYRMVVEDDATLVWLPEPVIAAQGCHHDTDVAITLGAGARLLAREELLLGRHGEAAGRLRQRVRVTRVGRPVFQQDLELGGETARSPAVLGGFGAVGTVLVADPRWTADSKPAPATLTDSAASMPLATGAVVVSAIARASLELRCALDAGVAALEAPWGQA